MNILKSRKAIHDFITKGSKWSTKSLLGKNPAQIAPEVVNSILDLSGLSKDIPKQQFENLQKGLQSQLNFIDSLSTVEVTSSANLTRLMDDNSNDFLSYDQLMDQIKNIEQDPSKGEPDDSWNATGLAKETEDGYFLVNEGLIKTH